MLTFVFYLHWTLMILVGIAGWFLIFRPHILARLYMIGFLAQQLVLNGCIMTMWENKVKIDMGAQPRKNEFIMAHILNPQFSLVFKVLFIVAIFVQIMEIYKSYRASLRKSAYKLNLEGV